MAQTLRKQTVASLCNELKSTAVCLLIVQVCDKSYNIEVDISTGLLKLKMFFCVKKLYKYVVWWERWICF